MNSNTSGWLVLTRNFVAGSHPQNDNARDYGIQTNFLRSGYELTGSKQPLTGSVYDLGLILQSGTSPQIQLLKWNILTQRYDIYSRVAFGSGWSPNTPTINVGEGFFMRVPALTYWVQNFTVQ